MVARIETYCIAFSIEAIVSVHEAPLVSAVPGARPTIRGAVRARGRILFVYDMRRALRLPAKPISTSDRLILLRSGPRTLGVIVDEIMQLETLTADDAADVRSFFQANEFNERVIAGIALGRQPCAIVAVEELTAPDDGNVQIGHPADATEDPAAYEILLRRSEALAEAPAAAPADSFEAVVFRLGGQLFAAAVNRIAEYFRDLGYSPLPAAGPLGVSLINRRGDAIALYDVRPLLQVPGGSRPARIEGLVIELDDLRAAIVIDSLEGLEHLEVHYTSPAHAGSFCKSIHDTAKGPVQVLDLQAMFNAPQFRRTSEELP